MASYFKDSEERRSGIERRHFSYSHHIPERRRGGDRKKRRGALRIKAHLSRKNPAFSSIP
jgi:hypothetical protein